MNEIEYHNHLAIKQFWWLVYQKKLVSDRIHYLFVDRQLCYVMLLRRRNNITYNLCLVCPSSSSSSSSPSYFSLNTCILTRTVRYKIRQTADMQLLANRKKVSPKHDISHLENVSRINQHHNTVSRVVLSIRYDER